MKNFQKIILLQLALIVYCFGINSIPFAFAADFDKGMEAYNQGDYETALAELKPLARRGDVKAQFNVAKIYYSRKTSSQDQKEAIEWYTKAAEQKHAFSQYTLGHIYAQEQKSYVQSYAWYNLALSQGNETARKGRDAVMMKMTPEQLAEGRALYAKIQAEIYKKK